VHVTVDLAGQLGLAGGSFDIIHLMPSSESL
jgi:hypothetical protein